MRWDEMEIEAEYARRAFLMVGFGGLRFEYLSGYYSTQGLSLGLARRGGGAGGRGAMI